MNKTNLDNLHNCILHNTNEEQFEILCTQIETEILSSYNISISVDAHILNFDTFEEYILDCIFNRTNKSDLIKLEL